MEAREPSRLDEEDRLPGVAVRAGFTAFENQRNELLKVLEPLPPVGWERFAMVTERDGEIEARTVIFYGDWLADHERQHWEHLEEIVAAIRDR